jgi:mRNA-degrading endonuclease RelE of RelBE toxin-antitoxin system
MKYNDYRAIYDNLRRPKDIYDLSEKLGLDEELLDVLYTQRTVRETTRSFYKVKNQGYRLIKEWKSGTSLLKIAKKWRFSPILTGLFIFQEMGHSKKEFWKFVRDPEGIKDARLRKEIIQITNADFVYSPWASEKQYQRGVWGEDLLQEWLDEQDINYRTEKDLRGEFPKTPDCLFDKPMKLNGWEIHWIESKATFGDNIEIKKNIKRQLAPYVNLFGRGLVVYWFGFLDDFQGPEDIIITDDRLLKWKFGTKS